MAITPELVVALWFVPVIVYFVVPVLLFPIVMLMVQRKYVLDALSAGRRASRFSALDFGAAGEKRAFPRERLEGIFAQVSDGERCCASTIVDVCPSGICLVSARGSLDKNARTLGVLLTGTGDSFHMQVKPRWYIDRGEDLNIGASIEKTIGSWNVLTARGKDQRFASAG